MTQLHERFENSVLVEAWLKEPTFLEPVDEGRVAAIVHHTPQVRRWPPQVDPGRFVPMLNAAKFVAASVVLALVGGLLLNVLPSDPNTSGPDPATVKTSEPETVAPTAETLMEAPSSLITFPDELPEGVTRGTLETPAGPLEYLHVADPESMPLAWVSDVLPWGDGIAAFQGFYTALVATKDGVNWEPITLPRSDLPGMEIAFVDGKYIAVSPDSRVWTSAGPDDTWRELDATQMAEALGNGWRKSNRRATAPTQIDGRIVFGLRYTYDLPRQKLGITKAKTNRKMKRLASDRYALCGNGSCKDGGNVAPWKLRFEETARGLRVYDDQTGKRLGLIAGASLEELYEGGEATDHRAFTIDGDTVVPIVSPWPQGPDRGSPTRGGQLDGSMPPAGAPAGYRVSWIGNAWLAEGGSSAQGSTYWLHLGGAWHSLDEVFGRGLWSSAAGLGNVTLLSGDQGGHVVLLHPSQTE